MDSIHDYRSMEYRSLRRNDLEREHYVNIAKEQLLFHDEEEAFAY